MAQRRRHKGRGKRLLANWSGLLMVLPFLGLFVLAVGWKADILRLFERDPRIVPKERLEEFAARPPTPEYLAFVDYGNGPGQAC